MSLEPDLQEIVKSAATETFIRWWARWQKQNADALKELQEKHDVQVLRTPDEILIAFLKTWDEIAAEQAAQDPFFKKVLEFEAGLRQRRGAGEAGHVPALLLRRRLLLGQDELIGEL